MSASSNLPPPPVPWRTNRSPFRLLGASFGAMVLLGVILFIPIFVWFFCRIEPGPGQIAILIHKTGQNLPTGEILAPDKTYKGVQLEVLPEGRYFYNPYSWDWQYAKITDIPAGKVGVQTRLYGKELPAGEILAAAGTKGILPDVLGLGKHRINPFAIGVEQFDAISIKPGCVGVVTALTGKDVLNSDLPADQRNGMLVSNGLKGVVGQVLDPGTYYLNPYLVNVVEVNLQSQRFAMSGDDAIRFLTADGFDVNVEGTLEFAIARDQAARITHRIGDMDDVLKKVILPRARGFSRVEGSKYAATNFIVGETRQQFQTNLEAHLRERCKDWGVDIKSVLIRNIIPPEDIASIIRDREVAVQTARKFEQQIEQAKSKAELTKQERLAEQSKEKVDAETLLIKAVIKAEQDMSVLVTNAAQGLAVAQIDAEAAIFLAQAQTLKATAERDVIRTNNLAAASVLSNNVQAFGTGLNFARYQFYTKLGPRVNTVLSSDQKDGLGSLFQPFLLPAKEVKP